MAMNPTPNQYTPKINEAINKAVAKNTSLYDQLTNINRGRPNIAPSPTATPMVQQKPNLRQFINQEMMGKRPYQPQAPTKSLMNDIPLDRNPFFLPPEEGMPTAERNPFQMDQDMIRKTLENLRAGIDPRAVQANPQGYLEQQKMQQLFQQLGQPTGYPQQPPLPYQQQMDEQARMQMRPQPTPSAFDLQKIYQQMQQQTPQQQQPLQPQQNIKSLMDQLQGMNTPMQTPQPAGLGSLVPRQVNTSYGGGMGQQPMGTQNTQLGNMGQPAQNTQPAFGGNILGQKNAFG
jgi:hypothetical protein